MNKGFWADIEKYILTPSVDTISEIAATATSVMRSQVAGPGSSQPRSAVAANDLPRDFQNEGKRMEEETPSLLGDVDDADSLDHPFVDQSEIYDMKMRYIVGKAAGEDLFDKHGNQIVQRNHSITVDVLRRAEQAGVLVELIVHMVIPALGE